MDEASAVLIVPRRREEDVQDRGNVFFPELFRARRADAGKILDIRIQGQPAKIAERIERLPERAFSAGRVRPDKALQVFPELGKAAAGGSKQGMTRQRRDPIRHSVREGIGLLRLKAPPEYFRQIAFDPPHALQKIHERTLSVLERALQ